MTRAFSIVSAEQRSAEWFAARVGRLTASCASDMLDILKDGKSDGYRRRDLRARLVCERLTGLPQEDGYVNAVMQRGIDLEPLAFAAYEAHSGHMVRRTGFLSHDSLLVGASLDGDVDEFTGIVECKCPKAATHLGYLKAGTVPANHLPQIYHELWITGAQWCDFVSFDDRFPEGLQLFVCRVPRVEIDILAYEKNALRFLESIEADVTAVRGLLTAVA